MPDVYEALRRQVLDGIMADLSTLKYWKFAEVVNNVTSMSQLGTGITFLLRDEQGQMERPASGHTEDIYRGLRRGAGMAGAPCGTRWT